jgi:hypothetical protein
MKKTYIVPAAQAVSLELQGIVATSVKIYDRPQDNVDPSQSLTKERNPSSTFWE